jgi:uncharacterized protein (DUF1778 family)
MNSKLFAPTDPMTNQEFNVSRKSDPPEKEFSGNLHFRIDAKTHRRIDLAATQSNKKFTAWVKEALTQAADEALGYESVDIASPAIRALIEDPDYAIALIETIIPVLKEDNAFFILKFNAGLKKLLIGLDGILPFFPDDKIDIPASSIKHLTEAREPTVQFVAAIAPFLNQGESYSLQQFVTALKKLLIGLDAVKPFLKDDPTTSALEIVAKIGDLLIRM